MTCDNWIVIGCWYTQPVNWCKRMVRKFSCSGSADLKTIGDWSTFILIFVSVHSYMHTHTHIYIYIYTCIIIILMSQTTRCGYCFDKFGSVTVVLWHCITSHPSKEVYILWPQQTEDGYHQSMWNTPFKPFRSDCDMTRFRLYQTLDYIIWTLFSTPIYHFVTHNKPQNSERLYWQHFESLWSETTIVVSFVMIE